MTSFFPQLDPVAMSEFTLDPRTTALVVIDLQRGIVATPTVPHASADVIARASDLARHFRSRQSLVVLVRVDPGPGGILFPRPIADIERPRMNPGPDWAEIVPELGLKQATSSSPSTIRVRSMERISTFSFAGAGFRRSYSVASRRISVSRRRRGSGSSMATIWSSPRTQWRRAMPSCTP